ncbi:MAG: InlB B-repeat-containing protein [Clostridia bacterium]|nr:InlB B-repeat-containing protein [Clostridia bacterium]
MKKRKILFAVILSALTVAVLMLGACRIPFFGDKDDGSGQTYTIMYAYNDEVHTIEVRDGELYTIPKPLPQKEGYDFLGLFDAEEGGTQYVNSQGVCLTEFYDKKNIVLYPQFAVRSLRITLDFGKAQGSEQEFTVPISERIPRLPADLSASFERDKYEFAGWFTQADCGGEQVAGADGISDKIADAVASYADKTGTLKLYAGFRVRTFAVNFYDCKDFSGESWAGAMAAPFETLQVPYGSGIMSAAPATRANGQKILAWSRYANGSEYTGTITSEENFYVREYAIQISFDTDGGTQIPAMEISNRGKTVDLPDVTKPCYTLTAWTCDGSAVTSGEFVTSEKNLVYRAEWERVAWLVSFSEGSTAQEVPFGQSCVLPVVSRTGYSFDGWQHAGKTYTATFTPTTDSVLTAVWKANTYTVTLNANGGSISTSTQKVTYGSAYTLPLPVCNGYMFDGWCTSDGKTLSDANGGGMGTWSIASDVTVLAHWTKLSDISVSFTVQNCANDNGYNPAKQASEADDRSRHNGFEVVQLVVRNAKKRSGGSYFVPHGNALAFRLAVMQDVTGLPLNNNNEKKKDICADSYNGAIYGTNISGKTINRGAYYVKISYADGTSAETNATNILEGKKKGNVIDIGIASDPNKKVTKAEIVVVYEIYTGAPGVMGIWWNEYTNWRCSVTLNFD